MEDKVTKNIKTQIAQLNLKRTVRYLKNKKYLIIAVTIFILASIIFSFILYLQPAKDVKKTALASNAVQNLTLDNILTGSCGNFQVAINAKFSCLFPLLNGTNIDYQLDQPSKYTAFVGSTFNTDFDSNNCYISLSNLICENIPSGSTAGRQIVSIKSDTVEAPKINVSFITVVDEPSLLSLEISKIAVTNTNFTINATENNTINSKVFVRFYKINYSNPLTLGTLYSYELTSNGKNAWLNNQINIPVAGKYLYTYCVGLNVGNCIESKSFEFQEVIDINIREMFAGHNDRNADRINLVVTGYGYKSNQAFFNFASSLFSFDGEPKLLDFDHVETNDASQVRLLGWGVFSIEPFKSNKNKFNVWYIPEQLTGNPSNQMDLASLVKNTNNQSIKNYGLNNYTITLGFINPWSTGGEILPTGNFPSFLDQSNLPVKNDISFGYYTNLAYDPWWTQRGDSVAHELGHNLFGIADEYNYPLNTTPNYLYPNCARNQAEASQWWGGLVGQIDPFYYTWKTKMLQYNLIDANVFSEDIFRVGYVNGGCFSSATTGVVRPTITGLYNIEYNGTDIRPPVFGSVNRRRAQQILDLFSGSLPSSSSSSNNSSSSSNAATSNALFIFDDKITLTPNPITTGLSIFGNTDYTITVKDDRIVANGSTAVCTYRVKELSAQPGDANRGYTRLTSTIISPHNNGGTYNTTTNLFDVTYNTTGTTNLGTSIKITKENQKFTDYNLEIRCKRNSDNQLFARDERINFLFGAYSVVTVSGVVV